MTSDSNYLTEQCMDRRDGKPPRLVDLNRPLTEADLAKLAHF